MTNRLIEIARPIVNINGSSARSLVDQRLAVVRGLEAVLDLMHAAAPHGRDYQLNPPGDLDRDRDLYLRRLDAIKNLATAYEREAFYIHDQEKK